MTVLRIAAEGSLLITDIVVEFEDGALADIEIQKIGYAFPGERSACYSADLLLRQYKRVREKQRGKSKDSAIRISKMSILSLYLKKAPWKSGCWKTGISINRSGDLIRG